MVINDPNGSPLRIRDNGFALNYAAVLQMEAHAAHNGDCYSLSYNIDPNVAGDFLYIKNSHDNPLRVYKIKGHTAGTGGAITIKTGVTGTPTTGVDLTPVNTLIGSGNLAEGTFNRNTSGASMALTGGNTLDTLLLVTAVENIWYYSGEVALEKNQTMVLTNAVDPAAVMTWTLYFYYHEIVE
jgi:hypothetical protein